jgi:hypothetical protein
MRTIYWINKDDIITDVSENWDDFAKKNNGEDSFKEKVINTSLFKHVSDDATKMWLECLLSRVRILQRPLEKEYRCDSSDLKRYMKLTVMPLDEDSLELRHDLVYTEEIVPAKPFKFKKAWRVGDMIRCSICNSIKDGDEWKEIEDVKADNDGCVAVAYTVCLTCKTRLNQRVG